MYKKLLEYQEIDKQLKALEESLKGNEDYKKFNIAFRFLKTVNETKNAIEERSGYLLANLENLNKKYTRLLEEKAEFEEMDENMDESTANFLKKKSVELSKAFGDIEAEIEKLQKEMNDLVNQYKKLTADTKAMKEQYEKLKDSISQLQKSSEVKRAEITQRLNEIAKDIPAELMEMYQAARKMNKFPIVCVISEKDCRHCVACGTEFSTLDVAKLKKDRFIRCENCRKLIFLE